MSSKAKPTDGKQEKPPSITELFDAFMGDQARQLTGREAPEMVDAMTVWKADAWAQGVGAVLMREGTPQDMLELASVLAKAAQRRSWADLDAMVYLDYDEPTKGE